MEWSRPMIAAIYARKSTDQGLPDLARLLE
jgi:hypothetical protein